MTARHDLLDEAHAHPAVRDVLAVFPGAKISRVEPLPESSAGKREVRAEEIPWNGLDIEPVEPPAQAPPQVARLGARRKGQPVTASAGASIADDPFPMSEVGDAEFFARCMAGRLLHDHTRRRWFVFDRHHWRLDATDRAIQAAIGAMRRRQTLALQVGDVADRARPASGPCSTSRPVILSSRPRAPTGTPIRSCSARKTASWISRPARCATAGPKIAWHASPPSRSTRRPSARGGSSSSSKSATRTPRWRRSCGCRSATP